MELIVPKAAHCGRISSTFRILRRGHKGNIETPCHEMPDAEDMNTPNNSNGVFWGKELEVFCERSPMLPCK